jgi:hypothetical protein
MLADLLKIITPETLSHALRSNPKVVIDALSKLETYKSFGEALSVDQQVCVSKNIEKLNDFFKSDSGKIAVSILAEEFTKFVEA